MNGTMTAKDRIAIEERRNAAAESAAGEMRLSVLIPFLRDDPGALAAALNAQIGARRDIEIVLLDDGGRDPAHDEALTRLIRAFSAPARLLVSPDNLGRSAARNQLARRARGAFLLYLDADMAPGGDAFLQAYLDQIEAGAFDAAFGGFQSPAAPRRRESLHAAFTASGDEYDADQRERIGPSAFCASNLLVRAALMREEPFDERFTGWGFEDVEWAVRAAKSARLIHLDNPARHGGLDAAEILLAKFRQGAPNYARMLALHPELNALPGARAARLLQRAQNLPVFGPALGLLLRAATRLTALSDPAPLRLRVLALKLWRACWTARALDDAERTPAPNAHDTMEGLTARHAE